VASWGRDESAVDTINPLSQSPTPRICLTAGAAAGKTKTRGEVDVRLRAVVLAHQPMRREVGAGQRGAAAQCACLRMAEPVGTVRPSGRCAGGFALDGDLGYVGGCRSLARHARPFPCGRKPSSPQLVPALRPQQADRTTNLATCAGNTSAPSRGRCCSLARAARLLRVAGAALERAHDGAIAPARRVRSAVRARRLPAAS
jgi:hypothetical protein